MKKSLFAAVSLAISIQLLGIPYALAGRPLLTDDAWTVEEGKFQLETGLNVTRQDDQEE